MKNSVNILIADDHPIFRRGLKDLIEESNSDYIIYEAEDGQKAVDVVKKYNSGVAILDLDMPHLNGLQAAEECLKINNSIKIIILTMYKDEHLFNQSIDIGILGYVLKENAVNEILNAINSVISGQPYISPAISSFVINRSRNVENKNSESGSSRLTETERNILKLISESKTSREIAEELFVSIKTIEKHRFNICSKLNIHGTHALIKYAFENRSKF